MTFARWANLLYEDLDGVFGITGQARDFVNLVRIVDGTKGDFIALSMRYGKFPWIYYSDERQGKEGAFFIEGEEVDGRNVQAILTLCKRIDKKRFELPFLLAYRVGDEEAVNWQPLSYLGNDGVYHLQFVKDRNYQLRYILTNDALKPIDEEIRRLFMWNGDENTKGPVGAEKMQAIEELALKRQALDQELDKKFKEMGINLPE